jgi:hypothetical protein
MLRIILRSRSPKSRSNPEALLNWNLKLTKLSAYTINERDHFTRKNKYTSESRVKNNILNNITLDLKLPESINYTQPYWLDEKEQ